ncbi:MAG: nucleoside recognition domain-containing protein [Bacteroidales bacterium]|nr:nucleoside recognition domain-containing protein [Bacteroidales bacterium]
MPGTKESVSTVNHKEKILGCVRSVLPSTTRTCIWLLKITVGVSFAIMFLKYLNILPWFSNLLAPLFNGIGLPGEAALPFVTGYFVNVYAAISVAVSFDFDVRSLTILSTMVLSAHNMITETAVQKKTGTSAVRIVIIRTVSAFTLAFLLNKIMPGEVVRTLGGSQVQDPEFMPLFMDWLRSTFSVVIKMTTLIYSLAILQKLLSEYGVIRWISKFLKYPLAFFGLPARTSFLWIVANTLGLAYGAAVMMEEVESGNVTRRDINLLNSHIAISHSNLEDLLLLTALGALWYVMLFSRWAGSFVLVWELRAEYYIKDKLFKKNC